MCLYIFGAKLDARNPENLSELFGGNLTRAIGAVILLQRLHFQIGAVARSHNLPQILPTSTFRLPLPTTFDFYQGESIAMPLASP